MSEIDKWREEFGRLMTSKYLSSAAQENILKKYAHGAYSPHNIENYWQGFLMAKQSMPVIELPAAIYAHGNDYGLHWECDELIAALDKAGYPYKFKGDV